MGKSTISMAIFNSYVTNYHDWSPSDRLWLRGFAPGSIGLQEELSCQVEHLAARGLQGTAAVFGALWCQGAWYYGPSGWASEIRFT